MSEIKLLPCPFCGGKAEHRAIGGSLDTYYVVACSKCGIRTPLNPVAQSATDFWNRRTDADDGR